MQRHNDASLQLSSLRLTFLGANPAPVITGIDEQPGTSNYFIGKDSSKWLRHVPHYSRVKYEQVYPGIDLVYYIRDGEFEYDLMLAPGVDPTCIRLSVEGGKQLIRDSTGGISIELAGDTVKLGKPTAYDLLADGSRHPIRSEYVLAGNTVSFKLVGHDSSRSVVVDPVLKYSSYLVGTSSTAYATAVAVDATGAFYVTGLAGPYFPVTPGTHQQACVLSVDGACNGNAFVAKFRSDGSLVYSTYIGGSGDYSARQPGDEPLAIALSASGEVYITGDTASSDYPVTPGAFQTAFQCCTPETGPFGNDGFVTKLSADGSRLLYSTYFGSSGGGTVSGVAIDAEGNAYVAGVTADRDFPTTPSAFQRTVDGTCANGPFGYSCQFVLVAKINNTGSALLYGTYLDGHGSETASGIAVDRYGNAYVSGTTSSLDFPVTAGALQHACPIAYDQYNCRQIGFVTKLNSTGTALMYSTYLGGSSIPAPSADNFATEITSIVVDALGRAYVAGTTTQRDFPVTSGAFQTVCMSDHWHVCISPFVAKLTEDGSRFLYSTFVGAGYGNAVAVDQYQQVYLAGSTISPQFPVTSNAPYRQLNLGGCSTFYCSDGFVTTLNATGTTIVYYSTFIGGSYIDGATAIAVDQALNVYVAGQTYSADFPLTPNALQKSNANGPVHGTVAGFISKLVIAGDLAINAVASTTTPRHDSSLTYTFAVLNKGPDASHSDTLTANVPSGTTFVGYTTTSGRCSHPSIGSPGVFVCKRASDLLPGHWWGPITLTVSVNALPGSVIKQTASVTAATQDLFRANNATTVLANVH